VGQCAKGDVGLCRDRVGVERLHRPVDEPAQARKNVGNALPRRAVSNHGYELEGRMAEQKAHQLRAGVTGSANDDCT
jgi:hypothetical protein